MKYGITVTYKGSRITMPRLFRTKAHAQKSIVEAKKVAKSKRYKFHNVYKSLKNPRIFKAYKI